METVQERELQERAWWPLDTMACRSLDMSSSSSNGCRSLDMSSSSSNGCSFLFEWDPLLGYFGLGAVGAAADGDRGGDHRTTLEHELQLCFPKCMESAVPEDATLIAEDPLDELLRNFWDAEEECLTCFSPSCILKHESATSNCFRADDDGLLAVSSASPSGPTLPEETVAQEPQLAEQLPPCSSSSRSTVEPQDQRRANCSSKRPADDTNAWAWSSSKRSRKAAASGPSVVRPFTVVKPGGADGVATLADINERILTPPTRPVRHPVGEFACAPRTSAGGDPRPSPSGKTVTGFTRLHTGGKGTITIIRTTG